MGPLLMVPATRREEKLCYYQALCEGQTAQVVSSHIREQNGFLVPDGKSTEHPLMPSWQAYLSELQPSGRLKSSLPNTILLGQVS